MHGNVRDWFVLRSICGEYRGDFHLVHVSGEWKASVIKFSGG